MPGPQKINDKSVAIDYITANFDIESSESIGRRFGVSGQRIRKIAQELGLKKPCRDVRQLKAEIRKLKLKIAKYENSQHKDVASMN